MGHALDDPQRFHILATASRAVDRTRVLKHGETFAVFDRHGDVLTFGSNEQGLFFQGTRYLSHLSATLGELRPFLLGSTVRDTNDVLVVDLTNPDMGQGESFVVRGTLHLARSKFLWDGACYERWRIANHGMAPVSVSLSIGFESDFADIFEVRGTARARRGTLLPPVVSPAAVELSYVGLDGVRRTTHLELAPRPDRLTPAQAVYELRLDPQESRTVWMTVGCDGGVRPAYDEAYRAFTAWRRGSAPRRWHVGTSNEHFNAWIDRSISDLEMMLTETEHGLYPYAGVPWFSTPFGRDGIWTALELLWLEPTIATGVLSYLAATQAGEERPEQDAEPGKILHETRRGEMAALGEVPFGRYYGSVDATPLFVVLAGACLERTGDLELARRIWPHVERALEWIDRHGDRDGDGFVEFERQTPDGLAQQGWKDSQDSVFHDDGTLVEPPVALCEVQGYVFAARRAAARLARELGHADRAATLERDAEALRVRFEETFWCDALDTYAIALDGAKRACRVRTSNAGHALYAGIVSRERAVRLAATLMDESSFSGWGVRTLAAKQARYNPMSYHNGSIWPHDNAIVAAGLARYGLKEPVLRILEALFDASLSLDLHRMPELYCGFKRRSGRGPTLYPVACAPQAWAAGAVFLLLQAALGLEVDAIARRIVLHEPRLPPSLQNVRILGLRVGSASIDLSLERHAHTVGIDILRREGEVEVLTVS